jgi:hypothetical protein
MSLISTRKIIVTFFFALCPFFISTLPIVLFMEIMSPPPLHGKDFTFFPSSSKSVLEKIHKVGKVKKFRKENKKIKIKTTKKPVGVEYSFSLYRKRVKSIKSYIYTYSLFFSLVSLSFYYYFIVISRF